MKRVEACGVAVLIGLSVLLTGCAVQSGTDESSESVRVYEDDPKELRVESVTDAAAVLYVPALSHGAVIRITRLFPHEPGVVVCEVVVTSGVDVGVYSDCAVEPPKRVNGSLDGVRLNVSGLGVGKHVLEVEKRPLLRDGGDWDFLHGIRSIERLRVEVPGDVSDDELEESNDE